MTDLITPALRQLAHNRRAIHRHAHRPFNENLGRDARADHGNEINCVCVHRLRWLSLCGLDGLNAIARPFRRRQCRWHTLRRNACFEIWCPQRRCLARWHKVSACLRAGRGAHSCLQFS